MSDPITVISSTTACVAAFKEIHNGLKVIVDAVRDVKIQNAVFDIREKLAAQQEAYLALLTTHQEIVLERNALHAELSQAKQELANLKNTKIDLDRYQLVALAPGTYVYMLNQTLANGEPPHWQCPQCFNRRVKSILKSDPDNEFEHQFFGSKETKVMCPTCGFIISVPNDVFDSRWNAFA